jgi:hypothetical protein
MPFRKCRAINVNGESATNAGSHNFGNLYFIGAVGDMGANRVIEFLI